MSDQHNSPEDSSDNSLDKSLTKPLNRRKFVFQTLALTLIPGGFYSSTYFTRAVLRARRIQNYLGLTDLTEIDHFLTYLKFEAPEIYRWLSQFEAHQEVHSDQLWPWIEKLNLAYFSHDRLLQTLGYQKRIIGSNSWRDVSFESYPSPLDSSS